MFRIKKLALCAGAVLAVGMVVVGVWMQTHKPMAWPVESHDHLDEATESGLPHVDVEHVGLVDFGFRTGHLVPVEIRVETPANMTLETDINCTGDMKIVGRKDESERQKDGTTRYKLHLKLQSLMFKGTGALAPQNAWVAYITLMYRRGAEKPQQLKVTPIVVSPSKTYDDRKSKHAFDPELDWMPHHFTVTVIWLSLGAAGMLLCVRHLWLRRRKRVLVVKPVPLPKPVDSWIEWMDLTELYAAVITPAVKQVVRSVLGYDPGSANPAFDDCIDVEVLKELLGDDQEFADLSVSTADTEEQSSADQEQSEQQLLRSLALQIRQCYKLGRHMTWQEVSRRGQPLDSAIATILGACEESAVFGQYPITVEDIPALQSAYDVLAAAHDEEVAAAKIKAPKPRGKLRRTADRLARWCLTAVGYLAVWKYLRRKSRTASDTTPKSPA